MTHNQTGRLARVGAEASWVVAGQLFAFLGGFAIIKLLTAELGPAAYGQLALGISIAGVLHMFVYGPIEQTALRYVSVYRERGQLKLLFQLLVRTHRITAAAALAMALVATAAVRWTGGPMWALLVLVALLYGIAGGVNATLSSLQTALRHRRAVAVFQATEVWLRLGLSLAGLLLLGVSADAALLGFCLATAATAATQLAWVMRNPALAIMRQDEASSDERKQARSELMAYGRPYVAFAAFAWLGSYGDRWVVLMFSDEHSVGIYAALFQIANAPITLFLGVCSQFLVPLIFDRAGAGGTTYQSRSSARLLRGALVMYVLALVVIVAVAALFAQPIVSLLTNARFAEEAGLLWILCTGLGLASIGQLLVVQGLSQNRSREYVVPKAVQVIMLLVAGPVLVGAMGLTGMGLALCASGAAYLIAVGLTNRRFFRVAP